MSAESRNIGIGVFLMSIAVVCLASSGLCRAEADDDRYLNAVREFADKVLECGRDVYGPKHTPLFVDGVDADTLEPVKWKYQGQEWIMSNLATQQNLFRVFDGLTRLTGDPKYHDDATMAQALVRFLTSQHVAQDDVEQPFFAGCFGMNRHDKYHSTEGKFKSNTSCNSAPSARRGQECER